MNQATELRRDDVLPSRRYPLLRGLHREFRAAGGYAWRDGANWWASVRGVEPRRGRGKFDAMNAALEARAAP